MNTQCANSTAAKFFLLLPAWLMLMLALAPMMQVTAQDQDIEIKNHFDVVQQLGIIKSKSRQIVVMGKKNIPANKQDSLMLLYMDVKATTDGAISKYKSLIDNPKLAKKTGESISGDLNHVMDMLNDMSQFYMLNAKTSGSMGFKPIGAFALVTGVITIGKELYTEIANMQKAKRDANKSEVDKYVLPDYDEVK